MITDSAFYIAVGLVGLGTLTIRGSFVFLASKIHITQRSRMIFSFIPAAVLPALVTGMVYFHQGQVDWLAGKERMIVVTLAAVVSYYSKNMLVTILFGLTTLYCVTQFS